MAAPHPEAIAARFEKARQRRSTWESHWQDCYDFALPRRDGSLSSQTVGEKKRQTLYDGTAPDAVELLGASLTAELTPAWSRWINLVPGVEITDDLTEDVSTRLEDLSKALQGQFDQSNFQVEIHQCFLDLVTAGTACLLFEEAPFGQSSAFTFKAVPLEEVVMEEGPTGQLDVTYRRSDMTADHIRQKFPDAELPDRFRTLAPDAEDARFAVLEAVVPDDTNHYSYTAQLVEEFDAGGDPFLLKETTLRRSPFINFRWIKAPGEVYGRSPVMKMLPDIKTANKIVELMLKNASMAVTGIWQADDDGVLNPSVIKLRPGTIIPKAVGSQGLQPLQPANDFTLSESLLQSLRERIRHGLMADQLNLAAMPGMTATEVLQRSSAMTRTLGATFGRLQAELLRPLAYRALSILHRRGDVPAFVMDPRLVELEIASPLARRQRAEKAAPLIQWFGLANMVGPAAANAIDMEAAARWLAESMSVPRNLIAEPGQANSPIAAMGQGASGAQAAPVPPQAAAAPSAPATAPANGQPPVPPTTAPVEEGFNG